MSKLTTWRTNDGKVFNITDMETSHIHNCIALIKAHNWRPEYLQPLEQELKRRKTKLYKALK